MPLVNYDAEGTLTIGGILMNRPAFAIIGDERGSGGLVNLWADSDVRGKDRIVPTAAGVIPYPRRLTVTRHDLRLLVVGDVDQAGTPVADSADGLEANIEYIRTNVIAPVASSTGTRAATLVLPSAASRTADIHVLRAVTQSYLIRECEAVWIATIQISIPAGRFS